MSRTRDDAVSVTPMNETARHANPIDEVHEIAKRAMLIAHPHDHRRRRDGIGRAWLEALRFGDHDLRDDESIDAAARCVAAAIAPTPRTTDDRMDPSSIPSWRTSTPFGDAVRAQHIDLLRSAIDAMPPRSALMLRLRHGLGSMQEMSIREIADALGTDPEGVGREVSTAFGMIRASMFEKRIRTIDGDDEAICQGPMPETFRTSVTHMPEHLVRSVFRRGVIAGTHVLVDSDEKIAERARAAIASETIDPEWRRRDQERRADARLRMLNARAHKRAALAAASATATRAAIDTPTLGVGLKPNDDETRFSIYAFDGSDDRGGAVLLGGAYLTPVELEARCDDLRMDLIRYQNERRRTGRPR